MRDSPLALLGRGLRYMIPGYDIEMGPIYKSQRQNPIFSVWLLLNRRSAAPALTWASY